MVDKGVSDDRIKRLVDLESGLDLLMEATAKKDKKLSDYEAKISNLKSVVDELEARVSGQDADISGKTGKIRDLEDKVGGLESSLIEKDEALTALEPELKNLLRRNARKDKLLSRYKNEVTAMKRGMEALKEAVGPEIKKKKSIAERLFGPKEGSLSIEEEFQIATKNLEEKLSRFNESEEKISGLRAEVAELREDITKKEKTMSKSISNRAKLKKTLDEWGHDLVTKTSEIEGLQRKLSARENRITELQDKTKELEKEVVDKAAKIEVLTPNRAELKKLKPRLKQAEGELVARVSEVEELGKRLGSAEAKKEALQREAAVRDDKISELTDKVSGLVGRLAELEKALEETEQAISSKTSEIESLQGELTEKENRIPGLENRIKELEKEVTDKTAKSNTLAAREAGLKKLKPRLKKLQKVLDEKEQIISSKTSEAEELRGKVAGYEKKWSSLIVKVEDIVTASELKGKEKASLAQKLFGRKKGVLSPEDELEIIKEDITGKVRRFSDFSDNISRLEAQVAELERDLSLKDEALTARVSEGDELRERLSPVEAEVKALKRDLSEKERILSDYEDERSKVEAKVRELKKYIK